MNSLFEIEVLPEGWLLIRNGTEVRVSLSTKGGMRKLWNGAMPYEEYEALRDYKVDMDSGEYDER